MHHRFFFLLIVMQCSALLAYGLYLQYVEFLDPCPLCMVQRLLFTLVGMVAMVASLHGRWQKFYALLVGPIAVLGLLVAARQVWLQHTPSAQMLDCGAGLGTMLETLPLMDVLTTLIRGTGDCAVVVWTFWGLSIPEWAALNFVVIFLIAAYVFCHNKETNPQGA